MTDDSDQIKMRLKDLYRLRDLIREYGGADGRLRIDGLPDSVRTETEQLLDRIGEMDSANRATRQKLLLDLAALESHLDGLTVTPRNSAEISRLRRGIASERSVLTGLPPDPEPGQAP